MTAAIWSTAPNSCSLNFPALTLIRFMHNHHLLQISGRPQWLTIENGAHNYINSVIDKVNPANVHSKTPVTRVVRRDGKIYVTSARGEEEFDHVIFATHADTSLQLLSDPSSDEVNVLGSFEFSKNVATLHSDLEVLPPFFLETHVS
jgi:predicted NAD/FAD-binding protein